MAQYEEQVYEPLMGGPVNYNFDVSQPGAEEELRRLQALLRGEQLQPQPNRAPMSMDEALDLRRIQAEAQGWAAPVIYPDIMPAPDNGMPPLGLGRAGAVPDYRGASQVGGYAGPTRPSDKPFDFGIELKATPEGVDVGEATRQEQLMRTPLPQGGGPIKTVGDLTSLVRNLRGADKDVIEGVVAALTGIDPEKRKLTREQELAKYKQGLPPTSAEQQRIDIDRQRLKAEEQHKRYVVLNYLVNESKVLVEELKNPMMDPAMKFLKQTQLNKLNAIIAQAGMDIVRGPERAVPGTEGQVPPPAPQPQASGPVTLPGGVTVRKNPAPGTATTPSVTTPSVTTPSVSAPSTGGFAGSYEGRARQGKEQELEESARRMAAADGRGWTFTPEAVREMYRQKARRVLGQ